MTSVSSLLAAGPRVQLLRGPDVLARLGEDFDVLARQCGAPVTARRPWLETWIRNFRQYQPAAVIVLGPDDALAAAALFGVRPRRVGTEVIGLGHGTSDQSRLYAIDAGAAGELAAAVTAWLRSVPRPWRLILAQLPTGDAAVAALQGALTHNVVVPAPGSPMVRFQGGRSPSKYITANYRAQAKNKWNRMVKQGLAPAIQILSAPDAIVRALPRVMEIAGIRQEELTGRRLLDHPRHAGFFRGVVLEHGRRGEVELMVLRLGGEIGAYCLTFRDGMTARMWSGHYHPRWSCYSLGHILSHALLERCVQCGDIEALDWMKGLEPYKLRTANHIEPAVVLRAWSGWGGRSVGEVSVRLRTALKATRERYPVLRRLQIGLRRGLGRTGELARAERGQEAKDAL